MRSKYRRKRRGKIFSKLFIIFAKLSLKKCQRCKFIGLTDEEVENHVQNRHIEATKCSLCGEGFAITKYHGLSEHIKTHHPDQAVKCDQCSYVFLSDHQLQVHVKRSHSKATSLRNRTMSVKCTMCDEVFRRQLTMENHLIRYHQQKAKRTCRYCGKGFVAAYLLKNHEFGHSGVQSFLCTHCGKRFKTLYNLKVHQKGHLPKGTPRYQCTLCGNEYYRKDKLDNHRFKEHQEQMVFRCFKCGNRFESAELLAEHKKGKGEQCVKSICKTCGLECISFSFTKTHAHA